MTRPAQRPTAPRPTPATRRARACGALVVLLAAAAACTKPAAAPAAFERPPAPVRAADAVAQDVPVYLDEIGRAVARETVWVQSQVGGKVETVSFTDGAELKKGDVLFTIDARPFQARLDAADAALLRARAAHARSRTAVLRPQATLERAQAARDLARSELARIAGLVESNAVSRSDYDAKKSAVAMADAEVGQAEADLAEAAPEEAEALAAVKQAEADVAMARLDVEYCTVRAPIDGRAGHRLVDAGNLIEATGSPLVMVERLDPIYVDFNVTERHLTAVQRNMAARTLRVEAKLPDEAGDARAGELTFVDNAVQDATGSVKLRATIPNADRHFWPGRFVQVRLVLETLKAAVLVPVGAPQISPKGSFVYVVTDAGTAEMRPVVLGQRQGAQIVVVEGIRAGERVIVEGQFAVTPGGKVLVAPAAAEPAAAEPAAAEHAR